MQINNVFEICAAPQPKHDAVQPDPGAKAAFDKELTVASKNRRDPVSRNRTAPEKEEKAAVGQQSGDKPEIAATESISVCDYAAVEPEKEQDVKAGTTTADVQGPAVPQPVVAPAEMQVAMVMAAAAASVNADPVPPAVEGVVDGGKVSAEVLPQTAAPDGKTVMAAAAQSMEGNSVALTSTEVLPQTATPDGKRITADASTSAEVLSQTAASDGKEVEPAVAKVPQQTAEDTRSTSKEDAPKENSQVPVNTGVITESLLAALETNLKPEAVPVKGEEPVAAEKKTADPVVPAVDARVTKKVVTAGTTEIPATTFPETVAAVTPDETEQQPASSSKRRTAEVSAVSSSVQPGTQQVQMVDQTVQDAAVKGQGRQVQGDSANPGKQSKEETVSDVRVTNAPQRQDVSQVVNGAVTTRSEQAASVKRSVIPAPASPDVNALIGQIVKQAKVTVQGNRSEMVIRLQPEHLGTLNMSIVTENNSVRIHIQVDNKSVKDMLESNISQLAGSLTGQGIKVEGLGITIAQRSADTAFNFNGNSGWGSMMNMSGNGSQGNQSAWSRFSGNYGNDGVMVNDQERSYASTPAGLISRMQGSSGAVNYLV